MMINVDFFPKVLILNDTVHRIVDRWDEPEFGRFKNGTFGTEAAIETRKFVIGFQLDDLVDLPDEEKEEMKIFPRGYQQYFKISSRTVYDFIDLFIPHESELNLTTIPSSFTFHPKKKKIFGLGSFPSGTPFFEYHTYGKLEIEGVGTSKKPVYIGLKGQSKEDEKYSRLLSAVLDNPEWDIRFPFMTFNRRTGELVVRIKGVLKNFWLTFIQSRYIEIFLSQGITGAPVKLSYYQGVIWAGRIKSEFNPPKDWRNENAELFGTLILYSEHDDPRAKNLERGEYILVKPL